MSKTLPHELTGNRSSGQLLVFLHGFPDTTALWDGIVPTFEKDYYVLNVSYPNYSHKETIPKGIDHDEVVTRLKATIDQANDTNRKVVMVSHDWGAFFTYNFDHKYPNYLSEIIALDIGLGAKITLFMVFYQAFLAIAFMIGGFIGNWMTHAFIKYTKYRPNWINRIDSSWNYHYYYLWKRIFAAIKDKTKQPLYRYQTSCNLVYVYGTKKPFHFHGEKWLKKLAENPKNEVHGVESQHWIMLEQPSFLLDLIKRRLNYIKNETK